MKDPMSILKNLRLITGSIALLFGLGISSSAKASLILTVNSYTADSVSLTISGTFDINTVGDSAGYLAIKNAWSSNQGVHTEWFNSSPKIVSNTVTIGGRTASVSVQDGISTWNDGILWSNPLGTEKSIVAGTAVAGTIVLQGVNAFNLAAASTLELVSGFSRPVGHDDWARLEAKVSPATVQVPEPASITIMGLGLVGCIAARRRKTK